jgi:very-short-patch-repair endonuclease
MNLRFNLKNKETDLVDFKIKANKKHNNKYEYLDFYGKSKKCNIVCPIHGNFSQLAFRHLEGRGCQKCGGTSLMNLDEFINKASKKHNNKYSYPIQEFKNGKSKINIVCPIHESFSQSIESHLTGAGCPKCANNNKLTIEEVLKKFKELYDNKYSYKINNFINKDSLMTIKCPHHGDFEMRIKYHLNKSGCKKCSIENLAYSQEEFLVKCKNIHDNLYDYSETIYNGMNNVIKIKCYKHGIFFQNSRTHFRGSGCSKCKHLISKNEVLIEEILKKENILYETQKIFNNCVYKQPLKFDFYLPNKNLCIEFDGEQHFRPIIFFGGEEGFIKTKIRDDIKNNFCLENNIRLIRIKFNENIEEKINEIINEV